MKGTDMETEVEKLRNKFKDIGSDDHGTHLAIAICYEKGIFDSIANQLTYDDWYKLAGSYNYRQFGKRDICAMAYRKTKEKAETLEQWICIYKYLSEGKDADALQKSMDLAQNLADWLKIHECLGQNHPERPRVISKILSCAESFEDWLLIYCARSIKDEPARSSILKKLIALALEGTFDEQFKLLKYAENYEELSEKFIKILETAIQTSSLKEAYKLYEFIRHSESRSISKEILYSLKQKNVEKIAASAVSATELINLVKKLSPWDDNVVYIRQKIKDLADTFEEWRWIYLLRSEYRSQINSSRAEALRKMEDKACSIRDWVQLAEFAYTSESLKNRKMLRRIFQKLRSMPFNRQEFIDALKTDSLEPRIYEFGANTTVFRILIQRASELSWID